MKKKSVFSDGISKKKLLQEGMWETRKEMLGWIIDDVERTLDLPPKKTKVITQAITQALQRKHVTHEEFPRFNGKITPAALGIPWANGLLSLTNKAL